MELSNGVKQGRHRGRILMGQKLFRHARALQVRMAWAMRTGRPRISARDRTQSVAHCWRVQYPARAINSTPLR
jgi:hypothetical protein